MQNLKELRKSNDVKVAWVNKSIYDSCVLQTFTKIFSPRKSECWSQINICFKIDESGVSKIQESKFCEINEQKKFLIIKTIEMEHNFKWDNFGNFQTLWKMMIKQRLVVFRIWTKTLQGFFNLEFQDSVTQVWADLITVPRHEQWKSRFY